MVLGVAGVIAAAAVRAGNPERLTNGEDYTGQLCGVGNMARKPHVYYPRLAADLATYHEQLSSSPWAIPLYGLCVEECPAQGTFVRDYPCDAWHGKCLWDSNPLISWYAERTNEWHVPVGTLSILNRCMPLIAEASTQSTLCAYPDCEQAGKPCYTEAFGGEKYWRPEGDDDLAACDQLVQLETKRSIAGKGSTLELEFIGTFFGGVLGVLTDVYLGYAEIAFCGVLVALLANFSLLLLLRYFIRSLFYFTVRMHVYHEYM